MPAGVLWLNERDTQTDFGLAIDALVGWPGNLGAAPRDVPLLEGPEFDGALIDPRLIRQQPGRATIRGVIEGTSQANGLLALDGLRNLFGGGEVRVRTAYAPSRFCLATLETLEGEPVTPLVNGVVQVTLTCAVKDGIAFERTSDGYTLSTARTACPCGNWPSYPLVLLHGGGATLTNPSIVVRNAAGDPVQSMGFSTASLGGGVLGANDYLLIDSNRAAVSKSIAGTLSAAELLWNAGDFPVLRPADGWVEDGVHPTVELTASAGSPRGTVSYRRRYR